MDSPKNAPQFKITPGIRLLVWITIGVMVIEYAFLTARRIEFHTLSWELYLTPLTSILLLAPLLHPKISRQTYIPFAVFALLVATLNMFLLWNS